MSTGAASGEPAAPGGAAGTAALFAPQGILDALPAAVYVCDPDGLICQYNAEAARLWGRRPTIGDTDLRFCGAFRLFHLDGRPLPHAETPMAQALRSGEAPPRNQGVVIERPDGSRVRVMVNIVPLRDDEGRLIGAVNAFIDVGDRLLLQEELRQRVAELEGILDLVPIGIGIAHDRSGTRITGNPRMREILGVPEQDANLSKTGPGREALPFRVLRGDVEVPDGELPMQVAARAGREVPPTELDLVARDGSRRSIVVAAVPLLDEDGTPRGSIGVFEDVSERKRSEEERERHLHELRAAYEQLEQFTYITSHDFQEPLRMVGIHLDLLGRRTDGLDGQARWHLEHARQAAVRLRALIVSLQDYTTIMAATGRRSAEVADLAGALENALANLDRPIAEAGARVVGTLDGRVRCGEGLVTLVLQNLVANAIRYRGDEPPLIRLEQERRGDALLIGVRDNGIGVPADARERIFEIFRRVEPARGPGSGIGLAICRRIVDSHGGRIWVEANEGGGSVFRVLLPAD